MAIYLYDRMIFVSQLERNLSTVIVTVAYTTIARLFFLYFAKSNSSLTLVDLIFSYLIYSRDTYLILPITSRSLSHIPYLSFQMRWLLL